MIKILSLFTVVLSTQLITIIMWGEHVWLYKFVNGGVGGTPLEQIQPILWIILLIEAIIYTLLAIEYKKKNR